MTRRQPKKGSLEILIHDATETVLMPNLLPPVSKIRGGRRPGSGRKPGLRRSDTLTERLTVRLSKDDRRWLKERGHPGRVVRELIAAERRREGR